MTDPDGVLQLRHALLRATDRAIGAEAAVELLCAELADARETTAERDALRKRVTAMERSATWRTGRVVVGPIARLAKRRRR